MKKTGIIIGIIIVLAGIFVFAVQSERQSTNQTSDDNTLQDAHGLTVDRKNSARVNIATHSGLFAMGSDAKLQRVGAAQDDYMGFSSHPTDANTFYTSGHPSNGGNIGFQKSTDGGKTWQKIADGVGGPVDFHAMAVSQADPNNIYGVYRGQLQRSSDEGKNWELVSTNIRNVITLATDGLRKEVVFAGTTDGLYASNDNGSSWIKVDGIRSAVTAISINIKDNSSIIYADGQGLMRSTDGMKTWDRLTSYSGAMVTHLASYPKNPSILYLINQGLEIHKTTDTGQTWQKVR